MGCARMIFALFRSVWISAQLAVTGVRIFASYRDVMQVLFTELFENKCLAVDRRGVISRLLVCSAARSIAPSG